MRANSFPLHQGSGWEIDTVGVDLKSKLYFRDDRIILPAGIVAQIEGVIELFSTTRSLESFKDSIEIFYENKGTMDEFIYKLIEERGITSSDTNCLRFSSGKLNFYAGGSGRDYFRTLLESRTPDVEFPVWVLATQLLAEIIRLEFADHSFPTHAFGGAYEICIYDGSGFQRMPYTIIDSICQSELAEDGVYDIDAWELKRVIFCCPLKNGTAFFVFLMTDIGPRVLPFIASEINYSERDQLDTTDIKEMILSHDPAFTISILRHNDVNFAVTNENCVRLWQDTVGMSLNVDEHDLRRIHSNYMTKP